MLRTARALDRGVSAQWLTWKRVGYHVECSFSPAFHGVRIESVAELGRPSSPEALLAAPPAARKQSERLKSALRSSRGGAPGGPGAKGASGSSSGKASAKAKARKEEARGKKAAKKGFG